MARDFDGAPPAFSDALASLSTARTRQDVALAEAQAPARIAPYAVAISGEVTASDAEGSGRFVLLHDPSGHDAWEGEFRIVALVKARVSAEVGGDDIWSDVAWSWLEESLTGVAYRALGGTVSKVLNRSYGELAERPQDVVVELRVSWTPLDTDMEPHVQAWTELMAACAGVPPLPEGVTMLPGSRP
ncbi:DUF3000 domain-containing protein [Demequina sediminicola]|uniref:DUF3000 domain-containing protein n=1 Tax=Demequina sediminicola TaxID=1095026 RepID=UPI0009E4F403|nr:DUF3000 domain-containing protein [Demequina sediminicola]